MILYVVLAAIVCLLSITNLTVSLRLRRPQIIEQKDFRCPYCKDLVTGVRELDVINHVACIDKANVLLAHTEALAIERTRQVEIEAAVTKHKADIKAKEREEARLKQEEEDRKNAHTYRIELRDVGDWAIKRWKWFVYKGGALIDSGVMDTVDRSAVKGAAERAVENHKAGKPPIGDKMNIYTVQ